MLSNFSSTIKNYYLSQKFIFMTRFGLSLVIFFLITSYAVAQKPIALFNGKDLSGWHIDVPDMDKDSSVKSPFLVRNGRLVSLAAPVGHIITDKIYENYELTVTYRFAAKPGNCGVLVHCSTPRRLYGIFPKSIECQLMHTNAGDFWVIGEDIEVPNMVKRRGPKINWGFNEDKERHIVNLGNGAEKPVGQWNTMRVICKANTITVWVNEKLMNKGYNATVSSGQIALQAEGSEVEFKSVLLEKLN
jgi:Domain of Unknown Function (DUF1080)